MLMCGFSTSAISLPTTTVQTLGMRSKADQLLQQGNQQYQAGQLQAAIRSWQEARRIYQQLHERQGEGRISGDGVIGLSRSFISAGVESVIVSLWSMRDVETSKLMKYFYQTLQDNPDKASALRQAMLMTMKERPEPLYWAAFTLIGES